MFVICFHFPFVCCSNCEIFSLRTVVFPIYFCFYLENSKRFAHVRVIFFLNLSCSFCPTLYCYFVMSLFFSSFTLFVYLVFSLLALLLIVFFSFIIYVHSLLANNGDKLICKMGIDYVFCFDFYFVRFSLVDPIKTGIKWQNNDVDLNGCTNIRQQTGIIVTTDVTKLATIFVVLVW